MIDDRDDRPDDGAATVTGTKETEDFSGSIVGAMITVLTGEHAGHFYTLGGSGGVLGRGESADVVFNEDTVSRRHAAIRRDGEGYTLTDLGSHNGTHLDGLAIHGTIALPRQSRIQLGTQLVLQFNALDLLGVEAFQKLSQALHLDPLTGTGNRLHLEQRLAEELSYARRHGQPFGVLLLDLDHFKDVNDTHGHLVGDQVLAALGRLLLDTCRSEDAVFRYGGEEFSVLVRGLGADELQRMAERIRKVVAGRSIPVAARTTQDGQGARSTVRITVSIGVASLDLDRQSDRSKILLQADRALYAAKTWGRNRVERYKREG